MAENTELNLEELSPEVQAHIAGLTEKVNKYESEKSESETKIQKMAEDQEAKDQALKEKMKSQGDLQALVDKLEMENADLKAGASKSKRLDKQIRDAVNARAENLPEHVKALIKDLSPEVALKHMDTLMMTDNPIDMPETGGDFQTRKSRVPTFSLDAEQKRAAAYFGVSESKYREAVHKMKTREIR